jgi:hypothetical protein
MKIIYLIRSIMIALIIFILLLFVLPSQKIDSNSISTFELGMKQTFATTTIEKGMAVHITVVYSDQPGQVKTLLGLFAPAIGITVRMRTVINNQHISEQSGITNQNGLVLLILDNPIIDANGHTQKVNISLDGFSNILTCDFSAYYQGYYSKEIFIGPGNTLTYFPG